MRKTRIEQTKTRIETSRTKIEMKTDNVELIGPDFIYDPYLINRKDLLNTQPGRLIRLRRPAWGDGIQNHLRRLK